MVVDAKTARPFEASGAIGPGRALLRRCPVIGLWVGAVDADCAGSFESRDASI